MVRAVVICLLLRCACITCSAGASLANAREGWQGDGAPLQQLPSRMRLLQWPVLENQQILVIAICTIRSSLSLLLLRATCQCI